MTRRIRALVALIAAVALAVPVAALARNAAPVKNGNYCINCTKKKLPGEFHVSKTGRRIDNWEYYNDCARVPVIKHPAIAIRKGAFKYSGTLTDVTRARIHFTLKGHFVSPREAVGVVNATGGGRTCKATTFKAKFTRTGSFQA
jgi:hypothetical protein